MEFLGTSHRRSRNIVKIWKKLQIFPIYTNKMRSEDWGPVFESPRNIYLLFFFFPGKKKKFHFFLCLIKNRSSVLSPHFVCIDRKYFFSFQINKSQFILVTKTITSSINKYIPHLYKGMRTEDWGPVFD